jgi:adenosine kinase
MLRNKALKIVVSGSLAYDSIMDFPGSFADHILPEAIHNLNLSFTLSGLKTSFGGTAGNIAYNLSLLNEQPTILGVVGSDFAPYEVWLKKNKIDVSRLGVDKKSKTAAANIMTDRHDNQITGFYPGPLLSGYASKAEKMKNISLAIISPEHKSRMLSYAKIYRHNNIPFIFDPGQMVPAFSAVELRQAIKGAKVLIGNDYEIKLIVDKLKIKFEALLKMAELVIITRGEKGSEIYREAEKITIKPAKPKNASDPTGAGDAYRAGLIKGLIMGYNLKTCGQLAGLVSVYTVEKFGTQTHRFTISELKKRYQENFKEKLDI